MRAGCATLSTVLCVADLWSHSNRCLNVEVSPLRPSAQRILVLLAQRANALLPSSPLVGNVCLGIKKKMNRNYIVYGKILTLVDTTCL